GSTLFISIPNQVWMSISGGILLAFGLTMVFPEAWTRIALHLGLYKSETFLHTNSKKEGLKGAILLGASLGPVFTTCSPTYAVILAILLPASFTLGLLNLVVYALGLMGILLLIAY